MRATHPSTTTRALIRTIRDVAVDFLEPRVTNALESAAEELAAQASLAQHQRADAAEPALTEDIRLLRDLCDRTAGSYCDELSKTVDRALTAAAQPRAPGEGTAGKRSRFNAADDFEVALISDDELELSVMVSTVASRFERRNREVFETALEAVAATYGTAHAEALRSVVGVFPLINRFSRLLAGTGLSMHTRSTLMHAFQFHVLEELGRLYQPLAKSLHRVAEPAGSYDQHGAVEQRPATMSDWSQLLHGGRAAQHHCGATTGEPLIGYLGRFSSDGGSSGYGGYGGHGAEGGPAVNLYDQVLHILEQECRIAPERMPGMDMDVLRLVSLFFETFLNDDDLPTSLRFLVGRLQMPVLRVALADGAFFDGEDHMARRLIEALCQFGVGWSSDVNRVEHSPAFKEVSALVNEVVDHADPDAGLLQDVTRRLESLHAARQGKASRAEGRVVELEVGRAKLRAARLVVQDVLNGCLERHRCIELLRSFFQESWSKVLTFVCLRHGSESAEWRDTLALCDELAEVFTPAPSREEARQRTERVPHLLERLEVHMVEAGLTSSHIDHSLESLYDEIDRIRHDDDRWFESDGGMIVEQAAMPEPITLIPEPARFHNGSGGTPEDLEAVRPGCWVRVRAEADPEGYDQVKVAARVTETREILLVDERGARWGIWHEAEFAAAMADGRIALVDPEQIVQATLDAMITQLTQSVAPQGSSIKVSSG